MQAGPLTGGITGARDNSGASYNGIYDIYSYSGIYLIPQTYIDLGNLNLC